MKQPKVGYNWEIAPGYRVTDWFSANPDPHHLELVNWDKATEIFDARIRKRFLSPADVLIAHEIANSRQTFGFAILAIDFLVIETLQGFKEGATYDHSDWNKGKNKKDSECEWQGSSGLVQKFLCNWAEFQECAENARVDRKELAKKLFEGYRCALHHSGATKGSYLVGISGPIVSYISAKCIEEIKINRTRFHNELKREFENYLEDLRKAENTNLREKFINKMNYVVGLTKFPT